MLGLHCCAGFSLVAVSGGCSLGFSLRWLLLLRSRARGLRASVVAAQGLSSCGFRALEHRLSSCGTWALLLHGVWDLPRPGIELVSRALAGRFLPAGIPEKSLPAFKKEKWTLVHNQGRDPLIAPPISYSVTIWLPQEN